MIEWKTERRKVTELNDYPHNPRIFTDKGMADLKASMVALGYIDPIAINLDGTIIGGHARKHMLLELGLNEVDVRVPDRLLTKKQVEEAIIRLNRNTAGTWDFKILEDSFEQSELVQWGFEKSEFNAFGSKGREDAEIIPPLPVTPVSRLGDIWILGDHRLACGSSTHAESVTALLAGARPMLMVTDPPYGVNYDPTWRDSAGGQFGNGKTKMRGAVANDDQADWSEAWALFPGDTVYVWHGALHAALVAESLIKQGFMMRSQIIWVKQQFALSRGDYHWMHEPCWYAVRKGKPGNWKGGRKQTSVWEITSMNAAGAGKRGAEDEKLTHGTQKPVECMKRPIENNSKDGDYVYEPFSGSGTTIIAAEMTGRKCLAMELDPCYVDMAVTRWQNFTKKQAVHAETGRAFSGDDQVAQVRKVIKQKKKAG